MSREFALLTALGLLACTENGLYDVVDPGVDLEPRIEVDPVYLDFGELKSDESATLSFTVTNVGSAELEVDELEIIDDSEAFAMHDAPSGFDLDPDESRTLEVRFTPKSGSPVTVPLHVHSDDPDNEITLVDLVGLGRMPELAISPDPLDFGEVLIGCQEEGSVLLTNTGNHTLEISDIAHDGSAFTLLTQALLPLVLEEGGSQILNISYAPDAAESHTGTLTVSSDEPMGVREAAHLGEGASTSRTDSFLLPDINGVDIVFFGDTSGSMGEELTTMHEEALSFVQNLEAYTEDWQIITVTGKEGCATSGLITPDTAGWDELFATGITTAPGNDNVDEWGLYNTAMAISESSAGGCNEGFLRDGRMLHIIMLSDEPDHSPGWYDTSLTDYWRDYVETVVAIKGSLSMVTYSAIIGDQPKGCDGAEAGTGYHEAVSATGGVELSICSNWWESFSSLAEVSVSQSMLTLSEAADPDSIVVRVNGEVRADGWSYDASSHSVLFDADPPTSGDFVEINYAPEASCL